MLKKSVTDCFGLNIRKLLKVEDWEGINEIRVRTDKPLILKRGTTEYFIDKNGRKTNINNAFIVSKTDIEQTLNMLSDYSLYAFKEQLKYGFVTVNGGHRAAIGGTTVSENGKIMSVKHVGSISLRIAEEKIGCSNKIIKILGSKLPLNMLIVSPVCGGKTTMLRDMVRVLSDSGYTVGVSDERGEIAACYMGVPQLNVGLRTDVLDCCPKAVGMSMLIRTMSPDIVAADEIGSKEDLKAIKEAELSGTSVICTAHGTCIEDIEKRFEKDIDIFNVLVFLEGRKNPGNIKEILNNRGEHIC